LGNVTKSLSEHYTVKRTAVVATFSNGSSPDKQHMIGRGETPQCTCPEKKEKGLTGESNLPLYPVDKTIPDPGRTEKRETRNTGPLGT